MEDRKWGNGFLYVAVGKRYIFEAEISAKSLRRFTKFPICLVTDDTSYKNELFDIIVTIESEGDFVVKIRGMKVSPFEKTFFLDTDTFVCSCIDNVFDVLGLFDMAMTIERTNHSYSFFKAYNPSYKIRFENVLPEYNTGVIAFQKNENVLKLMEDWLRLHIEMNIKADMPSFREAFIENAKDVRISALPFEYNYHGTHSFGFATNEIKIFHERTKERWSTLTTLMNSFPEMDKKAKSYNRFNGKRIIIPYIGPVPYMWSPYRIKYKIKKMLGIKKTKKAETF
jgi:hypothetical protein